MSETSDLQFDRAEPAVAGAAVPSGLRCAACDQELRTTYWQVNGAVACGRCHAAAVREHGTRRPARFLVAGAYGTGAAAVGALLYYAVAAVTGYELGLIGIAVGLGVGFAVRKGSRGRGGWVYQALAMLLTYLAIVSTYIPAIVTAFRENPPAAAAADATAPRAPDAPVVPAAAPAGADVPQGADGDGAATAAAEPPSLAGLLVGLGTLLAFAMALPFLAGLENFMGLVIIGVSLYEAWKLNRRSPFDASGPHDARGELPAAVPRVA